MYHAPAPSTISPNRNSRRRYFHHLRLAVLGGASVTGAVTGPGLRWVMPELRQAPGW